MGHTDYVRTAAFLPSSPHLLLSGSYDATVRLWDTRTGEAEITMSHAGYAVESVLPYPQGGLILSSGGPLLRAFDLANPSKPLRSLSNHQKTITSLAFTSSGSRLLSGSLDQMVKVWDVSSFKVVHTMRYSAPVLSVAISPDDTHLACGLADSTLSVRQRKPLKNGRVDEGFQADDTPMNPSTYTSFLSAGADLGELFTKAETARKRDLTRGVAPKGEQGELIVKDAVRIGVKGKGPKKLRVYDRFLKEFRYGAALDAALAPVRLCRSFLVCLLLRR
jgi:U3 small nucleolar RNA-associated protein 15